MMKKVLLIATVQSHIGQFHKPLMRLLKANGCEVHVAARNNLAEKNGLKLEFADKVFDIPFQRSPFSPGNIAAWRQLAAVLRDEHYDVIHCNTPVGGIIGRLAAGRYRRKGTKVLYTAHGFHFYQGAPLLNWLLYYPIEWCMAWLTDQLITINSEDDALASRHFRCPCTRIHGVGANSERYQPATAEDQAALKEDFGLNGKHVILCVGELLPNKNQKTAILAMDELRRSHPDAILLIAGNGSERDRLEQLVREKDLTEHVRFIGYTTDLPRYMRCCDMLMTCSHREGLPMNVVEAMLCGKPVVASDNRGHRELVRPDVNGCLVRADDAAGFAQKAAAILDGGKDWQDACWRSVPRYTDEQVSLELAAIYGLESIGGQN